MWRLSSGGITPGGALPCASGLYFQDSTGNPLMACSAPLTGFLSVFLALEDKAASPAYAPMPVPMAPAMPLIPVAVACWLAAHACSWFWYCWLRILAMFE